MCIALCAYFENSNGEILTDVSKYKKKINDTKYMWLTIEKKNKWKSLNK